MVWFVTKLIIRPNVVVLYTSNPITGECIRLPTTGEFSVCAGFGYCQYTNVYKVVVIGSNITSMRCVYVYTLGVDSDLRYKPEITYDILGPGVFANGSIYWSSVNSNDIVAFDLTNETFRSLPLPRRNSPPNFCILGFHVTLQGDLCSCLAHTNNGEHMIDIWVFKKKKMNNSRRRNLPSCFPYSYRTERAYFNSFRWIKVFSRKWDSALTHMCQLISLTESEMLLWLNGVLSCYDPTTSKKLWCSEGPPGNYQAIPHMNTLVLLKDLGGELVDRKDVHPEG